MHFLLLALYGILNRVRGSATLPKVPCYMLFGVLACITAWTSGMAGDWQFWLVLWLLAFLGSYFGFMFCWGKYFPNDNPVYDHTCVALVDKITDTIYMPYTAETPTPQVLNWKTIGMSVRFIIFFAPKYALLAGYHVLYGAQTAQMTTAFVECLLLLAVAGPVYRFWFGVCERVTKWAQYNVAFSEVTIGFAIIGVCDWLVL